MGLARTAALVLGGIYVLVGIAGFIPALVPAGPDEGMESASGALLGMFPTNAVHNIVHLAIGAALLFGSTARPTAIIVSRVVGATYVVVGLAGIPFPNGFGLLPLGGADILLHLATGAALLYIGYLTPAEEASSSA
ncbi:MAG TPA: DUF4383 domain-containing protein [candidate division Zixibacteria bacterium]|nr:DUF4383 domain-containing protein [candidate division Zixibacteria bacterium]